MVATGLKYPIDLFAVQIGTDPPQASIVLQPTSGVEGAEDAVTSSGDIGGALLLAADDEGLAVSEPETSHCQVWRWRVLAG